MAALNSPPEQTLLTPHPYQKFLTDHADTISLPHTIHTKLYDFINQSIPRPTLDFIKNHFPYLPHTLFVKALKSTQPLLGYLPSPLQNIPPRPPPYNVEYSTLATHFTTWNILSLNTSLPCLHSFINTTNPSILTLQETKITSKKSPKYLQWLFPQYKLLFNNTHAPTRTIYQPGIPYTPPRGGLLTLIHSKHAYPNNISKIPLAPEISPYLQITKLANLPLTSLLLIHLYMPSHPEDLYIMPTILTTITHQINHHLQSNIILSRDFNRDLSLTGCTLNDITEPPHPLDYQWQLFTHNLGLQYIPTDTTYTRQSGPNYTHSSLIDGYFIKTTHNPSYTSHTNINFPQNSDHFHVSLHIPHNTLLARPPLPPQARTN
jgi:hypothetical protein